MSVFSNLYVYARAFFYPLNNPFNFYARSVVATLTVFYVRAKKFFNLTVLVKNNFITLNNIRAFKTNDIIGR